MKKLKLNKFTVVAISSRKAIYAGRDNNSRNDKCPTVTIDKPLSDPDLPDSDTD